LAFLFLLLLKKGNSSKNVIWGIKILNNIAYTILAPTYTYHDLSKSALKSWDFSYYKSFKGGIGSAIVTAGINP